MKRVLTLKDYAEEIALYESFVPATVDGVDKASLVDELLTELQVRVPAEYDQYDRKRKMLHGKINTLPANTLGVEAVAKLDTLLQLELLEKNIADVGELPGNEMVRIVEKTQLKLWQGDIATLKIDAVVNAANSRLLGCFHPLHNCIDNVIHTAAGVQLRDDCNIIMGKQGGDEGTGLAKITRGYNLPATFVIYTVGPIVEGAVTDAHQWDLAHAYTSCLELCREVEAIRSIAFCCISTGVFGYPQAEAAAVAFHTVSAWVREHPDALDTVVFNVFLDADRKIYEEIFKESETRS